MQNIGFAFRCDVGGWYGIGGPYAPGTGWAWQHAWTDLGECDDTTPVVEFSLSHLATATVGDTVDINAEITTSGYVDSSLLTVTVDGQPVTLVGGGQTGGSGGGAPIISHHFYRWQANGVGIHNVEAVLYPGTSEEQTRTGTIEVTDTTGQVEFTMNHTTSMRPLETAQINISASNLSGIPEIVVMVGDQQATYSGSSSSSGGSNYSVTAAYTWQVFQVGSYDVVATLMETIGAEHTRTGVIEVSNEGIELGVTFPDSLKDGQEALINITAPYVVPATSLRVTIDGNLVFRRNNSSNDGPVVLQHAWKANGVGSHELLVSLDGEVTKTGTIAVTSHAGEVPHMYWDFFAPYVRNELFKCAQMTAVFQGGKVIEYEVFLDNVSIAQRTYEPGLSNGGASWCPQLLVDGGDHTVRVAIVDADGDSNTLSRNFHAETPGGVKVDVIVGDA